MTAYLIDPVRNLKLWEFDCTLSESSQTQIEWTEKPLEDGTTISDHGNEKPRQYTLEGAVTAWPLSGGSDPTRVVTSIDELVGVAQAKQPVTMISIWHAEPVVLESVQISSNAKDGDHVVISVQCRSYKVVKPESTQIPVKRLAQRVRKAAAPKRKGGAETGKTPAPESKEQSYAEKVAAEISEIKLNVK